MLSWTLDPEGVRTALMRIWLVSAFEPIPSDGVRPARYMGLASVLLQRGHDVSAA